MMSSAAKTVSFSPLRRGNLSLKNTLDTPFMIKWPNIPAKITSQILLALEESLSPMKGSFSRQQRAKRKPQSSRKKRKLILKSESETLEPPEKKQCIEITTKLEEDCMKVLKSDEHADRSKKAIAARKSQLVIGVNKVTRCLERGELAAGCVCLTAKPALVTRHILMLAATRSVPFAALPNLSQTIVACVGDIKSALAIGFKTCSESEFSSLIQTITRLAPPIVLPWLTELKKHSGAQDPISLSNTPLTTSQPDLPEATPTRSSTIEPVRAHQDDSTPVPLYTTVNVKKTISGERKKKGKK